MTRETGGGEKPHVAEFLLTRAKCEVTIPGGPTQASGRDRPRERVGAA